MSGASPAKAARIASRRHRKIPAFQAREPVRRGGRPRAWAWLLDETRDIERRVGAGALTRGDHVP